MLKGILLLLCFQLLAFPLLASPLKGNALINLPTASPNQLALPETVATIWLRDPFDALVMDKPTLSNTPKMPHKALGILSEKKELGYINATEYRTACDTGQSHSKLSENNTKFAANIDSHQLIYFDYSLWAKLSYDNRTGTQHQPKKIGDYVVTHELLGQTKDIRHCVINNIIINYEGMVEANHISINNNHIILEKKP